MKKYDFTIVGGASTVQVFKFNNMPQIGQTETAVNPRADEIFYGGCAFNVFYGLTKLGVKTFPVLQYGDPRFEAKLAEICTEYGIPMDGISGPHKGCYNTCVMLQDDNRNHITFIYKFGENSHLDIPPYDMEIKGEYFTDSKMTLMVMSSPSTGFKVLEKTRKHNLPLAFSYRNDPNLIPNDLLEKILGEAMILFTNEIEAKFIEDTFGYGSITDLFKISKARIIVTTLGKRGCVVYEKKGEADFDRFFVPPTENELGNVDAIGAGDGFVAGFMYGYINGKSVVACAQYGSTLASFVIEKDGSTTNLPTPEQLLERNSKRPDAVKE